MMELDYIACGDSVQLMKELPGDCIDLTVTSPPYDNLRKYNGCVWDFETTAQELFRITKPGGVVVWVVGDQTIKGSETGTSFRQALYFMECGFRLHDTMIYHKSALPMNHNRYEQDFEYMFVFSKGRPKTFNPIRVPCKYPEKETARGNSYFSKTDEINRKARSGKKRKPVGKDKIKGNIWYYPTGKNHSTHDEIAFAHPAIFPEALVADHLTSWSNPGDIVFDPFVGSGTTAKMAVLHGRHYIGFDCSVEYCELARKRVAGVNAALLAPLCNITCESGDNNGVLCVVSQH